MENLPLEIWDLIFMGLNKPILAMVCKVWYFIIQDLGIKPIDYKFTKTTNPSVHAALHGDLNILRWLQDQGCQMGWETKAAAILNGTQSIIDFVNHIPLSHELFAGIALTGQEEPFAWLFKKHCPYPHHILIYIYKSGNYDLMEYFRWDIDFVMTPKSFKLPAIDGNLKVLKILDSLGPYNDNLSYKIYKKVIKYALENNHLEIVKWALKRIQLYRPDFIPFDKKDEIDAIINDTMIGNIEACAKLKQIFVL